jgi:hypothetical protein
MVFHNPIFHFHFMNLWCKVTYEFHGMRNKPMFQQLVGGGGGAKDYPPISNDKEAEGEIKYLICWRG